MDSGSEGGVECVDAVGGKEHGAFEVFEHWF